MDHLLLQIVDWSTDYFVHYNARMDFRGVIDLHISSRNMCCTWKIWIILSWFSGLLDIIRKIIVVGIFYRNLIRLLTWDKSFYCIPQFSVWMYCSLDIYLHSPLSTGHLAMYRPFVAIEYVHIFFLDRVYDLHPLTYIPELAVVSPWNQFLNIRKYALVTDKSKLEFSIGML